MGLGIVLIVWAAAGVISAMIGALALAGTTHLLTRRAVTGHRRVMIAAFVFPFACLGWGACVFVLQGVMNETVLHRDLGLGDTWHAPLPNGYQVMMIDVTDQGWIYNPKTQGSSGGIGERADAVAGVRRAQAAGRYILGATESKAFENFDNQSEQIDGYFILDTQTGEKTQLPSYDALQRRSRELNINLDLQPIYSVYSKFRFGLFDVFAGLLLCGPPTVAFILLAVRVSRLRRSSRATDAIA